MKIDILDTTLRDGAQSEGISFSVSDKLEIIKTLDEFGVDIIEAGNPNANPKDVELFEKAQGLKLKNAKLCAFGSTAKSLDDVENTMKGLIDAHTSYVSLFGKASVAHVKRVLQISLEENLELVGKSVRFLKDEGKYVIFDAEHFFDGYLEDKDYALKVVRRALVSEADCICLCDTNGGNSPMEIYRIVREIKQEINAEIGIHCHNDRGCGVANTLLAVEAGATHVQGTFNGIGERCGNAALEEIIPNLQIGENYECVSGNLSKLKKVAVKIAEISNIRLSRNTPYIGDSAFAHKGGMHIDGVRKYKSSFEHISPELVGNKRKFLVSEVAGKNALMQKLESLGLDKDVTNEEIKGILERLKEKEHEGYQYEAADASFEILVRKMLGSYKPFFNLEMYKTSGEHPAPDGKMTSTAILKITVKNKTEITAAMGNGPVHALDEALRKALVVFYPELKEVYLSDFKVRVLDTKAATAARVRVLIESTDGKSKWSTVGVSSDVIAASWEALVDSIEYPLIAKK